MLSAWYFSRSASSFIQKSLINNIQLLFEFRKLFSKIENLTMHASTQSCSEEYCQYLVFTKDCETVDSSNKTKFVSRQDGFQLYGFLNVVNPQQILKC